tara:strand:- start:2123 stop:2917 length:795 start_codon:yes stop_codon:yes gene_type:complete
MICFNNLGLLGRLGNQMFQYAATKGIAARHGYEVIIPNHNRKIRDPFGFDLKIEIHEPFLMGSLNRLGVIQGVLEVNERMFTYDEELVEMCPDNTSISGYFQTEKYFKHIKDDIRKDFTFHKEIIDPCKEMIDDVGESISLHVRRTDYNTNPNHADLDLSYYQEALNRMPKDIPVILFSDDTNWCKEQDIFSSDRFMVSESDNHHVDLCLMTMCKYHINANSSFSWWGAWLADSKRVIAPSKWFGAGLAHQNTADIYAEGWEVL